MNAIIWNKMSVWVSSIYRSSLILQIFAQTWNMDRRRHRVIISGIMKLHKRRRLVVMRVYHDSIHKEWREELSGLSWKEKKENCTLLKCCRKSEQCLYKPFSQERISKQATKRQARSWERKEMDWEWKWNIKFDVFMSNRCRKKSDDWYEIFFSRKPSK